MNSEFSFKEVDKTTCTRLLCVIAIFALLILIVSLIGLGFTIYWYWDELKQHRHKDDPNLVNKIKVYVQHPNKTSAEKHTTIGIYKHKVGWHPHPLPTTTEHPSDSTSITTQETTTRIRVTNEQLRKLLLGDVTTPTPATEQRLGLPKRKQTVTIVTALLDIGRGRWPTYSRPLSRYHFAMKNVLSMRVPMVIFTDSHSLNFVQQVRDDLGLLEHTKIWNITMKDLPLFKHHRLFHSVINHELHGGGWHSDWDPAMKTHPEARSADYDILVNSKPYFIFNASRDNPFQTENFAWIDAGYAQGESVYFPADYQWYPIFKDHKMSLIKLTPSYDKLSRYTSQLLYRRDEAVISGGFLGGSRKAVARFYSAFHWKVIEMLFRKRMVDDDQTTLVLVINEHSYLFNVVHGDWFDAFRMF